MDRTNNSEEAVFREMKHDLRRQTGRKTLAKDLEDLPAAAALAANLRRSDYVELVCGHLDHLHTAFRELDREQAERQPSLDLEQTRDGAVAPIEAAHVISVSLPSADRRLIRAAAMTEKVLAAARSRAPAATPGSR